ncbi:protein phosphatase regulator [Pestalotiopsis sp. IQ-011]
MAVVLSSEDSGFFSQSPLKRSHSQPNFGKQSGGLHTSASSTRINTGYQGRYQSYHISPPSSEPSSAASSPQTIHADSATPSDLSTPATTLSLDSHWDNDSHLDQNSDIILPEYDDNPFFAPVEDLEPPASPHTGDSYSVSPAENDDTPTTLSRPESPTQPEHAEDDTALRHHPTHHVDYLSHDWKEEDIWSSWRYIISRRNDFTNASRLENASWRTWMKSKYRLKTVSPETLNWLKDCDVTWLYGPLQTRHKKLFSNDNTRQDSSLLSRNDSFVQKKPILKKRSVSEVMLQKSISSSSLLKQATAAVQAQQQDLGDRIARPILQRAATDYITFPFSSRRASHGDNSRAQSNTTSGLLTPSTERKHIHFSEQVQQCIAVDVKGEEEDEDEPENDQWNNDYDSDSSDDGVFMMKTSTKKKPARPRPKPRVPSTSESKTIAMLPSTTLKYREDTPEPQETAMKHSTIRSPPFVSPSASQETLRPSKQSGRFFIEDEEVSAIEETSTTPVSSPTDQIPQSGLKRSSSYGKLADGPTGMRRTESGMLMPYEEGDGQENAGIIGRVVDTVNTARDIAHVIWNVGWRR